MPIDRTSEILERTVRAAGIPLESVTVEDPANRATWLLTFGAAATPAQKTAAAAIVTSLVVDAAAIAVQDQKNAQAQIDAIPIATKAIVLALIDQLNVIRAALPVPLNPITPAQALAAIRAKAGTL